MKKNTYALAYEACEKVFTESGQIPTIATIRQAINTNSPATISAAIKAWKKALPIAAKAPSSHTEIPTPLLEAITSIWQKAQTLANDGLQDQLSELESIKASLASKETEAFEERLRFEHLQQQSAQKYRDEIAGLTARIEQILAESTNSAAEMERYRILASTHQADNMKLSVQMKQLQEKLNRLQSQHDKAHDWALKRIEEEKAVCQQNFQHELRLLQSESNRHKRQNALLQAKLEAVLKQASAYKTKIAVLEQRLGEER